MALPKKIKDHLSMGLTLEESVAVLLEFQEMTGEVRRELVKQADARTNGNGAETLCEIQHCASVVCLDRLMKNGLWPKPHKGGWILCAAGAQTQDEDAEKYVDPESCKRHKTLADLILSIDWDWVA